jgi:hypothetical protein
MKKKIKRRMDQGPKPKLKVKYKDTRSKIEGSTTKLDLRKLDKSKETNCKQTKN